MLILKYINILKGILLIMKHEVFDFYDRTSLKSYNLDKSMRYQLNMLDTLDVFTRKHCEMLQVSLVDYVNIYIVIKDLLNIVQYVHIYTILVNCSSLLRFYKNLED